MPPVTSGADMLKMLKQHDFVMILFWLSSYPLKKNIEVEHTATSTGLQALQEADSKHQTDVHEVWFKLYVLTLQMNGIWLWQCLFTLHDEFMVQYTSIYI